MAGFFKKLLGKKKEESESLADADSGSWTEHEVSVDVHASEEDASASLESNKNISSELTQELDAKAIDSYTSDAESSDEFVSKAPDMQAERAQTGDTAKIAILDEADLKFAMDQAEAPIESDPLDEITQQIQSELAVEMAKQTEKEKKVTLEKILEVTNQLKRPDFDEDFDV